MVILCSEPIEMDEVSNVNTPGFFQNHNDGLLLSKAAGEAIWDWDLLKDVVFWSPGLETLLGYAARDVRPDPQWWQERIHPSDLQRVQVGLKAVIESERMFWHDEYRCRRADGSYAEVLDRGYVFRDAAGKAIRIHGIVQDFTSRKHKEQTLRFLVDLNAATQQLTAPGDIMQVSARMLGEHLGADRCAYAEVEEESIFVITGDFPRDVPSIVGRWPVAAFGPECTRLMLENKAYVVMDVDTDPRIGPHDLPAYRATTIQAVICVPLHKAGKFTAAMAVHQKTVRRWTSEEIELVEMVVGRCWESLERGRTLRILRESEQRLRFMAESIPQKIFTTKPNGDVDYFNQLWMDFTGLAFDQISGSGWLRFIHPDDSEANLRAWNHSLQTGQSFQWQHRFLRHDGVYRWHLTRAHPMRDTHENVLMWIGSSTDIDDQVRSAEILEQTVRDRTARLQDIISELEAFSYSISHDMRAPLRSMQSFALLLEEECEFQLSPTGRDYIRRIVTSAQRMDLLIRDVLNYSRVANPDIRLYPVDLASLLHGIMESYPNLQLPHGGISIEGVLPSVLANEAALTQCLSNLLGNALKFVAKGVHPQVRLWAEQRPGKVRIFVQDNGIGIPKDAQERIFGMFQRLSRDHEGTGIGLAIVKKAAERMGGAVGVESEPGKGSLFWLDLLPVSSE
jgi:PAS domain S-box-containing protein